MDVISLAEKLASLSGPALGFAALITGALGVWGWTYQHKQQLELKDKVIDEVRKQVAAATSSSDYWREQATKAAETNQRWAGHVEQLTSILETALGGRVAP